MAFLEARDLIKRFGETQALSGATFLAERGEVHALLGENGAGKSTFIKILSGVLTADGGTVHIDGRRVSMRHPSDALRFGIGTVYQELSLMPDLTVADNLYLYAGNSLKMSRLPRGRFIEQTRELMAELQVHELGLHRRVERLSLAERQVVEIVKVVLLDPEIVILDEPTSALSSEWVSWLDRVVDSLKRRGKCVIFISHRMGEVFQFADRVTVFRAGSTVGTRNIKEATADELVAMMLGRELKQVFPPRGMDVRGEDIVLQADELILRPGNKLSLRIRRGEIVGVGGLAGQGQAELVLTLFGMGRMAPTVRLQGRTLRIRGPRHALSEGIALVPEDRGRDGLVLPMSIRENLTLALLDRLRRGMLMDRSKERALVAKAVRELQIKVTDPELPVSALSGGNQQKVVLAKLLLGEPKVLLLFDPTRGVDIGTKSEIYGLMRSLSRQGCAILLYSTDVEELVNMCDRVLILHDYRVIAELWGAYLTAENIIRASLGEEVVTEHAG